MNTREQNIFALARLGLGRYLVERVLRDLPAIQRAHEAECMAWPPEIVSGFSKRGDAAFARVLASFGACNGFDGQVIRQRDPRGSCVQVYDKGANVDLDTPVYRLDGAGFTAECVERFDRQTAAQYATK